MKKMAQRRSSNIPIDDNFLRKNLEEYRVDPVEAAAKHFRHLADVSKMQREEAEARVKGALKERDEERALKEEERRKYVSLSSTLATAQKDFSDLRKEKRDLENERDSAPNKAKELELRITELETKEKEAVELVTTLRNQISDLEADIQKARKEGTDPQSQVADLQEKLRQAEEKARTAQLETANIAEMALGMAGEGFNKALDQVAVIHPSLPLDREMLSVDYSVEGNEIVKTDSVPNERVIIYSRPSDA